MTDSSKNTTKQKRRMFLAGILGAGLLRMQPNFCFSICTMVMVTCLAAASIRAEDRTPQGVAPGIEKPLLIAPRPENGRNSEGDFLQLKDGRLLLVYTKFIGTDDHAPAELAARYSSDGGKTWGRDDVQIIARKPGEANLMSVSLLRLQDDRIALFYVQKYKSPPESKYSHLDYILMRTSSDEGATWSEPTYVVPKEEPGYRVLNNDRVIQLKTGRLVVPVAVHYLPGWPNWRNSAQIRCYLSDDQGRTWRPGKSTLETELLAQEPGVVELQDHRLMMFCRSQDCQLVSHSDDGGDTWSALERSKISQPTASPASIERIPATGDLLLVWNNGDDPLAAVKPIGRRPFTAAISKDEGATWEHIQNIGTDPQGWYCYTAIEFVGDHVLLAHCEYPGLNSLQVTRFPVKWLYHVSEAADGEQKK
ncbi:MAG TPA: sialidase family protein [Planctomycetaceae bacterium]|nr:sialidase family protein [Planctomycetaceae bacterium]